MRITSIYFMAALSAFLWSCNDDDETLETNVTTSNGSVISLDGMWTSDCIDFTEYRLSEDFDFDGDQLMITIYQSNGETCDNPDQTQTVDITFHVLGTIEATLDGSVVLGNKIAGTQKSSSKAEASDFKQTFYILEQSGERALYHGIFGDDGGELSSDGYPIELHPFAIVQQ